MKKGTLQYLVNLMNYRINQNNGEAEINAVYIAARNELDAELHRGAAQKAKNAEAYEGIHDIIMENLTDEPCTVAELWEVIKDKVPDGITKNKVQYALTHLWQDEIVKVEGKPNGYRKA